jgi:RNA polymerase sigma-70 factor (ECF subfamily)
MLLSDVENPAPLAGIGTPGPSTRRREATNRGAEKGLPRGGSDLPADVLARCREGDAQAFDCLFQTYRDRVYGLALSFCNDEAAAADITQDVFLKLLRRIHQFRQDAEFSTWLYRIVLNTFLDARRARKPTVSLDDPNELRDITQAPSQESEVARRQRARQVRAAIATLKPRLRAAMVLRYAAGLSYEQISEVLGVSAGTVASRLNRGHRRLAARLRHLQSGVAGGS